MANIKDLKRMCKEHHYCIGCPIFYLEGCMLYRLPSNIDEIIDKWVAEHPAKTYAHDFLKKFPNAELDSIAVPKVIQFNAYTKMHPSGCICRLLGAFERMMHR